MIDAILTGMTGRISTLHKMQPENSYVKQEQKSEEKAPSSLDSISLSKEAIELYNSKTVKQTGQSENYDEGNQNPAELTEEQQKKIDQLKKQDGKVREDKSPLRSPSAQDKTVQGTAKRLEQDTQADIKKLDIENDTKKNQPLGIAQYMKNYAPEAGSTINLSY